MLSAQLPASAMTLSLSRRVLARIPGDVAGTAVPGPLQWKDSWRDDR